MMPTADLITTEENSCKNCERPLEIDQMFCQSCGAKIVRNRLTIRNLSEEFTEKYFNLDNTFLKTFIHLFTKPEIVINSYISGTRKKYVNVASYFAITLSLLGMQYFIFKKFFPGVYDANFLTTKGMESVQSDIMRTVAEYQSLIMILYIPVYGIISRIVFFDNKKFNYTEHVVMFMYILSQTSLVSIVFLIVGGLTNTFQIISFFLLILQILYSAYVLKRVFALNLLGIFARTMLFLGVGGFFYALAVIGIVAYLFFNGTIAEVIEAQR